MDKNSQSEKLLWLFFTANDYFTKKSVYVKMLNAMRELCRIYKGKRKIQMKKFCLKAGAILLFFGILLGFVEADYVKIAYNEPVDIYGEGLDDVSQLESGLAIDTEVFMLMECFASEETTTTRRNGSTVDKDTDYYYILPVFVEDEVYYVGFCVDSENENLRTYERMVEETMAYMYGESGTLGSYSVEISGGLTELDEELYDYMLYYFREHEVFESDAQMEKYVLPITFVTVNRESTKIMFYISIVMLGLGAVLFLYGIFGDRKYSARRKQLKKISNVTVNINGVNYYVERMESVDRNIWSGKYDKAKKELMEVFKASEADADRIIAEWNQITGI